MKRIFITGLALMGLLRAYAQEEKKQDTTAYTARKLRIEEINLVSSYYGQSGDNAAVTGGKGSEELTDVSNILDVNLVKYDSKGIKHDINVALGVDHYTSASSDRVDLQANSSASSSDIRVYPSLTYIREDVERGTALSIGLSSSTEYDYQSFGGSVGYDLKTPNKNGTFSARVQAFIDQVKLLAPIELRTDPDVRSSGNSSRNTFSGSLSYSQIVNRNFQFLVQAEVVSQQGYLSLPFHRVYFSDGTVHQERLPDSRLKFPLAIRGSYFAGDRIIFRGYYRFYTDDWGIDSHTANLEVPVKLTPFFSISPFYRYYIQTAARDFDDYGAHDMMDEYYSSNYDLSAFHSSFFGAGLHLTPLKGILGIRRLAMLEIRYGHYARTTDLQSDIVSVNLKFK